MMPFGSSVALAVKLLHPEYPETRCEICSNLMVIGSPLSPCGTFLSLTSPFVWLGGRFQRRSSQRPSILVSGGLEQAVQFGKTPQLVKRPKRPNSMKLSEKKAINFEKTRFVFANYNIIRICEIHYLFIFQPQLLSSSPVEN